MGFTREAESPCPRVEGPTPQLATKRSLVPGVLFCFCWYQALAEHSTAAVGFHFGGRPHKRNHCFALTSLVLGGLHQRSGVALPTGGRADHAVGNEALAGTRRSVFSLVSGARWYPTLKPRQSFCMWYIIPHTKTKIIPHVHTCTKHTGTRGRIFFLGCIN